MIEIILLILALLLTPVAYNYYTTTNLDCCAKWVLVLLYLAVLLPPIVLITKPKFINKKKRIYVLYATVAAWVVGLIVYRAPISAYLSKP